MITYTKIDNNTYKKIETKEEIIKIDVLNAEIADLQSRLDGIKLIEITKDMSNEVKSAIDKYNGELVATEIEPIKGDIERKQALIDKLKYYG